MLKKITLSAIIVAASVSAYGQQVILNVMAPSTIAGVYDHTNQGDGSGWGLANLLNPADAVLDTLVMMNDGDTTTNNSYGYNFPNNQCGCDSVGVMNSSVDFEGKIVLISRGSCQFGWKAYLAQLRGAVGVIIYNAFLDSDPSGGLINMSGGDNGMDVTIPVAFVPNGTGTTLKAQIDAGTTTIAFLGAKVGAFQNDLAMTSDKVLSPPQMARPQLISADSNMYKVPLGFWMRNDGSANQTAAYASAEVTYNGSSVYSNTTNTFGLNVGDSSWISFPPFVQTAYPNGEYTFTYTVGISGGTDDFPGDNEISYTVRVNDNIFSYARVDADFQPMDNNSVRPSSFSYWAPAIHFYHSDASEMTLDGVKFAAYMTNGDSITGRTVDIAVYEWDDFFFGLNDPGISTSTLSNNPILLESFMFMDEYQDTAVTHMFATPIEMDDYQRYVVAVVSANTDMYINFSRDPSYGFNDQQSTAQPVDLLMVDGTWSENGWDGYVPTIQLIMSENNISVDEQAVQVQPFPVPAAHILNIPMPNVDAASGLKVYDMAGNLVISQDEIQKDGNVLKVDVSALPAATYVFNLTMQDGKSSSFNVVVGR
jgi:hypothetical protein